MHVSDFDYQLPSELIARTPAEPRDASRMMVVNRSTGSITDSQFGNFPDLLKPSDVLVLNDTRVIRARTRARLERRNGTSREMEVFFAEQLDGDTWQVLCMPGRRIRPGDRAIFGNGAFVGTFEESLGADLHVLRVGSAGVLMELHGEVPLPPYLERAPTPADDLCYQTVFGAKPGAVAAPTAGLHFTSEILEKIRAKGVQVARITLHVGIGTFLPLRTEEAENHVLRPERYEVRAEDAAVIGDAIAGQRNVIAVGTTTTRTLEFLMSRYGQIRAGAGSADLYILPGFEFRAVRSLLTNFHLPRSTLLMLVSAFGGRALIHAAYEHAVRAKYRFYSYGDCMFLARD